MSCFLAFFYVNLFLRLPTPHLFQVQDFIDSFLGSDTHHFLSELSETAMFGHYIRSKIGEMEISPGGEQKLRASSNSESSAENNNEYENFNEGFYQLLKDDDVEEDETETIFKRSSLIGQSTFYA